MIRSIINFIFSILGLKNEPNIEINNIEEDSSRYIVHISYKPIKLYCPKCGSRMHIKEKYVRKIKSPILLSGKQLNIYYTQRTWICRNSECSQKTFIPKVSFIAPNKQYASQPIVTAIFKLVDINRTFRSVAGDFGMSDTELHNLFMQQVCLDRLTMPRILCIDEVHTDYLDDCKYALILMDFETMEIVDILPSRRAKYTTEYFRSIPLEERNNVEFIISDMYQPYLSLSGGFFKNSVACIDSFHVIKYINDRIEAYIIKLQRQYSTPKDQPEKDEHYLLRRFRFLILKNPENIYYNDHPSKKDPHFGRAMPTIEMEKRLFRAFPELETMRDLKNLYISFNQRIVSSPVDAEAELNALIIAYRSIKIDMFTDFADLLEDKKQYILNSFAHPEGCSEAIRLNNSRLEGFNRKPKDYIRMTRSFTNFDTFKQRLLFNNRVSKTLKGNPFTLEEIRNPTGKERGYYRKRTNSTRLKDFILSQPKEIIHSGNICMVTFDSRKNAYHYFYRVNEDRMTCMVISTPSEKTKGKCIPKEYSVSEIDSYFKNTVLLEYSEDIGTYHKFMKDQLERAYSAMH